MERLSRSVFRVWKPVIGLFPGSAYVLGGVRWLFFIIVSFEPNMSEFLSKSAGSSRDYSRFSGKIFKNESNHSLLVLDTKIGRLTSVGKSKSLRGFPSFVFPNVKTNCSIILTTSPKVSPFPLLNCRTTLQLSLYVIR